MLYAAIIVLIIMGLGAAVAVIAFFWAAKNHQFENVEEGALSIFGPDEPVGEPTDSFPEKAPR